MLFTLYRNIRVFADFKHGKHAKVFKMIKRLFLIYTKKAHKSFSLWAFLSTYSRKNSVRLPCVLAKMVDHRKSKMKIEFWWKVVAVV